MEKEVWGMTEEQKNEGARKSRRSIRGMQRAAPFILLFAFLPHKVVRVVFFQKFSGVPQAHLPFSYAREPRPNNLWYDDEQWSSAVFLPIFTQARAVIRDYPFDCVAHPEYLVRTHGLNLLVLVYSVRRCLSPSNLLLKALLATGAQVSRLYWGRPEDDPRNGKSTFDESHPMTQALIVVCPTPCWCPEEADKLAWRWLDEWAWTLGNLRQRLLGVHDRMW